MAPSSLLLTILLTATIVATATATATATVTTPTPICKDQKITNFTFYLNFFSTNIGVIVKPLRNNSLFGLFEIADVEIKSSPEATSEVIGRSQGFLVGSSMEDNNTYLSTNVVFKVGPYSGSSLAVVGQVKIGGTTAMTSIVGGTGQFLMAKGYLNYLAVRFTPVGIVYRVDTVVLQCVRAY